ncbi:hypothetical protein ABMA28_016862 [Loxostege sticticalis]|uniref:Peptidase S1 domain-containing protein n=1 Tax=Loxostege sticticalis TaxID=481309 RepID=A0ABD0T911_LOXSC
MSAKIKVRVNFITAIIFILCLKISLCGRVRRIVGGIPVECGQQPRVVSIRNSTTGKHLCGATLLSPETAVTAAHCVLQPKDQYTLQLNNYCVSENETYPKARVVDIAIYDKYDRFTSAHDISILQISLELDDVTWLKDSILPSSSFGLSSDNCAIYGYGQTTTDSRDLSEMLLAGRVATVSLDECIQRLQPVGPDYDSGMICAVSDGGVDACQGDSGGPLVCDGSTLEGISSYGMSCGVSGLPGVYTSIRAHLSWIQFLLNKGLQEQTAQ